MFSPKPKKLNLREMWKLYKILKPALPEKEEEFLINELLTIIRNISTSEYIEILKTMYGKNFDENKYAGESALLFVKGIKKNKVFTFIFEIEGFTNGSS